MKKSLRESLERTKLLMNYKTSKTLTENKQLLNEGFLIAGAIVGGAFLVGTLIDYISRATDENPDAAQTLRDFILLGEKSLQNGGKGKPGYDPGPDALALYNAMFKNDYLFDFGATEDEETIIRVITSLETLPDMALLYRKYKTAHRGRDLVQDLEDSLQSDEWAPITLWIEKIQDALKQIPEDGGEQGGEQDGEQGGVKPELSVMGCLKSLEDAEVQGDYVLVPSQGGDGGFCKFYKNKQTQKFNGGRFDCFDMDGNPFSQGSYGCKSGKFFVGKNKLIEGKLYKKNMILLEQNLEIGGVDLSKSFDNTSGKETAQSDDKTPIKQQTSSGSRKNKIVTNWIDAPSCDSVSGGTDVLKITMKGACVSTIQQKLKDLGHTEVGPIDEKFGNRTEKAVKNFQTKNGKTASGIVDKDTYSLLFPQEKKINQDDYVKPNSETF
jgi:hypothetical protein